MSQGEGNKLDGSEPTRCGRRWVRLEILAGLALVVMGGLIGAAIHEQWPRQPVAAMVEAQRDVEFWQRWTELQDAARADVDRLKQAGETGRALVVDVEATAAWELAAAHGPAPRAGERQGPSPSERAVLTRMRGSDELRQAYRVLLEHKYPGWNPEE